MRKRPARNSDVPAHARRLLEVPNVGPATALDLVRLGISAPEALTGRDPDALYDALCKVDAVRHDPCVRDVFAAAVSHANGEAARPWWTFTRERKARGGGRMRRHRPARKTSSARGGISDGRAHSVHPRGLARWFFVSCLVVSGMTAYAAAPIDPESWRRALENAAPSAEGWVVDNLRIELGAGHLDIVHATLVPVAGPWDRTQELLVLGESRFVLSTTDPVEAYQLDLFTGGRELDEPVDRAVLVVADDAAMDLLRNRSGRTAVEPATLREAKDVLAAWRQSPDWRHAHMPAALLEDAEGDVQAQHRFAAWCHSRRLGSFLYTLDPFAVEQVSLEHFVDARIGDQDAESVKRQLKRDKEEGRGLGTRVEDLGTWDTWFSDSLPGAARRKLPGHEAFEPEAYDLHVKVLDDLKHVEGSAGVTLVTRTEGCRALHLSLHPDLAVSEVKAADGRPLRALRDGSLLTVILDAAPAPGTKTEIEVHYQGVLFERDEAGILYKRDTESWYPHAGTIDRAVYRAAFEVPASIDVLASGTKGSETIDNGWKLQTRSLGLPSAFFGFEIGHYAVVTRTVGHVALEVGFLKDVPWSMGAEREAVLSVISDALTTYESTYGPYPLDSLTIATTWQSFAQGFLGFVTLAQPVVTDVAEKSTEAVEDSRIIAHELAHQWWGNRVGWASYRDQWLSEALANYSAAIWRHRRAGAAPETRVASALLDMASKPEVLQSTEAGRPVEAIGPVTLGRRLSSSRADAYHAVVYGKGSMVFGLLAEQLGEEPFLAMLKEIAQRANNRAIDTDTFLAALSKMSGHDLTAFSDEFVSGVGYPEIHYRYDVARQEGGWAVQGHVDQVPRGFRRDRLVRVGAAGFDVAPTFAMYRPAEGAVVKIGGLVTTSEAGETKGEAAQEARSAQMAATRMRGYRVAVTADGPTAPLDVRVKDQPLNLRLDPRGFLPSPIWNETLEAKRGAERRADALRSAGKVDDAVTAYREALERKLEVAPEEAGSSRKGDVPWWNQRLDGRIHLALAGIALDQGRDADAETELRAREVAIAVDAEPESSTRRKLLRARLALRQGDSKSAYDILSGLLALDIRQTAQDTAGDAVRRSHFLSGWWGEGGDYLLLAAAAHATGHETICREAADEAERRGAATGLLRELNGRAASDEPPRTNR